MSTNGHHAPPETGHNRRNLLDRSARSWSHSSCSAGVRDRPRRRGDRERVAVARAGPTTTRTHSPKPSPSQSETQSESQSPSESGSADPNPTAEPLGDTLPDGHYFVRLNDLQGGEDGPLLVKYDLAYFLTGADARPSGEGPRARDSGARRLLHRERQPSQRRFVPLADSFGVKLRPRGQQPAREGAQRRSSSDGSAGRRRSDFPPKETSWWWITIAGGEVAKVEQQFLP